MATDYSALTILQRLEDPLAYLNCSSIQEYKKDNVIYGPDQPSTNLYLIVSPAEKLEFAVCPPAYAIAGPVEPSWAIWIGQETFGG